MDYTFTGPRREDVAGWSRTVRVGGQDYTVSVRRGRPVRIPYKPRGQNRGWQWSGSVYRTGFSPGHVWSGRVPGSLGCRGLLIEAGVIEEGGHD